MDVTESRRGDFLILELSGRLDSNTCQAFEKQLLGHIANGETRLVIDFANLNYISSAGLRVLLMGAKKVRAARGRIALSALSDHIREVFEVSGFLAIFAVHDSIEEAVA